MSAPTSQSFTLSYGDCDAIGISYFAIYYPWMERTYSTWLHGHGIASHTMPATLGVQVVGAHSSCSYFAPAVVFDTLRCCLRLVGIGRSSYRIQYDFVRESDSTSVAAGEIVYVCRSVDGTQAAPVPQALREALEELPRATATREPPPSRPT